MASTRVKTTTVKSGRCVAGTSIAELGPVLFVLFVMILFPLIDLMAIGVTYSSGCVLNSLQVREAALLTASIVQDPTGPVKQRIPDNWVTSGLGRFASLESSPLTTISYRDGVADANGIMDRFVVVTTALKVRPFLAIPFFPGVPGLGATVAFTITSERVVENPAQFN